MSKNYRALVIGLLLGLFTVAFMRTAWVTEDAYISFRVIENLLSGYGLVWNPGERVQVFTHPLWLFLLVPLTWFLQDPFWASLCLSYLLLLFVVFMLYVAGIRRPALTMVVLLILLSSRAFIDYSSSGLENPLVHALLVVFLWVYTRVGAHSHRQLLLSVLFALLYLARPDAVVIVLPALCLLALGYIHRERRFPWSLFVGVGILLAWSVFALFYFGSILPNTALAKLGTGLSFAQASSQAMAGVRWVAQMDILTLLLIVVSGASALLFREGSAKVFGLGIVLWFLYYFYAGGDYMGGRFFSPVVVVAAWLLIDRLQESRLDARSAWCAGLAVMLVVGLRPYHGFATFFSDEPSTFEQIPGGLPATLLSPADFHDVRIGKDGMADERGFYYRYLGLLPNLFEKGLRENSLPASIGRQAQGTSSLFLACNIGIFGYYAQQNIAIIDPLALADPLLSRLPAREGARVGHYERALPKGYIETLLEGTNRIEDPSLARLWTLVERVTRGELFSVERLQAIYELNVHGGRLVREAHYDRNDLHLPGLDPGSKAMMSCLGQDHGPFIWPVVTGESGVVVGNLASP
ncbi:hypothetical protein ACAW63_09670 [Pseudomonas sp. QE6]|uniref:hypothetical protein n=1 Tax=Pseudomonas sp. QE6 TaxID=3242491 RepID=UPI0035292D6C